MSIIIQMTLFRSRLIFILLFLMTYDPANPVSMCWVKIIFYWKNIFVEKKKTIGIQLQFCKHGVIFAKMGIHLELNCNYPYLILQKRSNHVSEKEREHCEFMVQRK